MPNPDVIGIGPGALSAVGEFYAANESHWDTYQALLNQRKIPVVRGMELEADDVLRREIMGMILAASCIRVAAIEEKWGIRFKRFFAYETKCLRDFEQKHWLEWQADSIRLRVRVITNSLNCAGFSTIERVSSKRNPHCHWSDFTAAASSRPLFVSNTGQQ